MAPRELFRCPLCRLGWTWLLRLGDQLCPHRWEERALLPRQCRPRACWGAVPCPLSILLCLLSFRTLPLSYKSAGTLSKPASPQGSSRHCPPAWSGPGLVFLSHCGHWWGLELDRPLWTHQMVAFRGSRVWRSSSGAGQFSSQQGHLPGLQMVPTCCALPWQGETAQNLSGVCPYQDSDPLVRAPCS